jgi:tRNA G18 (ribose-2'-O)-methylase SpoU
MQTACRKVRIPMCPGVDSLNVGVAGAIVLDRVIERLGGEPIPISGV